MSSAGGAGPLRSARAHGAEARSSAAGAGRRGGEACVRVSASSSSRGPPRAPAAADRASAAARAPRCAAGPLRARPRTVYLVSVLILLDGRVPVLRAGEALLRLHLRHLALRAPFTSTRGENAPSVRPLSRPSPTEKNARARPQAPPRVFPDRRSPRARSARSRTRETGRVPARPGAARTPSGLPPPPPRSPFSESLKPKRNTRSYFY